MDESVVTEHAYTYGPVYDYRSIAQCQVAAVPGAADADSDEAIIEADLDEAEDVRFDTCSRYFCFMCRYVVMADATDARDDDADADACTAAEGGEEEDTDVADDDQLNTSDLACVPALPSEPNGYP